MWRMRPPLALVVWSSRAGGNWFTAGGTQALEDPLLSGLTSTLVTVSGSGDTGGSESPEPSESVWPSSSWLRASRVLAGTKREICQD